MKRVTFFVVFTLWIMALRPCAASFDEERNEEHQSRAPVRGPSLAELDDYIAKRQALERDHIVKLSSTLELSNTDIDALMYGARIEISGRLYEVLSLTVNTLSTASCSLRPSRLLSAWSIFKGQRCCGRLVLKSNLKKKRELT